jgi:hypothetical protein
MSKRFVARFSSREGRFDKYREGGKLDKLPGARARVTNTSFTAVKQRRYGALAANGMALGRSREVKTRSIRSLRTQQRAQCQMPKTRMRCGRFLAVEPHRIPLEKI